MIDIKNPNALIAMAQVSQHAENPYYAFCEYIKYCIFSKSSDKMTLSEIRNDVSKEFGVYVPHNVILKCLNYIQEENLIVFNEYQVKRIGVFNTEEFDNKREKYRVTENELIKALIEYVGQFDRKWDYEYARQELIKVLDRKGLAYDIFIHGEITSEIMSSSESEVTIIEEMSTDDEETECDDNESQPLYKDSFFVGRFISETLNSCSVQKDYLLKVCEGLMLCVGVYQLPSADAELVSPQIKGTVFFFDTRLLLRYVGCAGEAAVNATKELVRLIQDSGGIISYYPQTLEEMERAFDEAIKSVSYGVPPKDSEMRLFTFNKCNNRELLQSKKASIKQELATAGIFLKPNETYSDKERLKFGFDLSDLQHYMESVLKWDVRTIENDAFSIWETHMKRQGNYLDYFGGSKKLPVFVTSNARLISTALGYREQRKNTSNIYPWKSNRLPVITDMRLTCRLWSPSTDCERLSLLYLTSNVVAAQNMTQKYIQAIRELAIELEKTSPEYSSISLSSYFDENVTSAILKRTKGQEENLNIGNFTSTLNELSEMKAKEKEEEKNKAIAERNEISDKYDSQTKSIITDAVESNKNQMGILGFWLRLVLWWPAIASLVFAGIGSLVSWKTGEWGVMWVSCFPALLKFFEILISSTFVERFLVNKIYPKAKKTFEKNIEKKLRKSEIPYKDAIIQQVMDNTNLWIEICKYLDD